VAPDPPQPMPARSRPHFVRRAPPKLPPVVRRGGQGG
jgi:hypothetical protein